MSPGFYFTNDKDWGTNPCCEIALRPYQFCNLVEINASDFETQEEYEDRNAHGNTLLQPCKLDTQIFTI